MKKTILAIVLFVLTANILTAQDLYPAKFPNGKLGYIDKEGNVKIEGRFTEANKFSSGRAIVKDTNDFQIINKNGEVVVDWNYKQFNITGARPFKNDIAVYSRYDREKGTTKYGICDTNLREITLPLYDEIGSNYFGIMRFRQDGKYGVIDYKGTILIPAVHDDLDVVDNDKIAILTSKEKFTVQLKSDAVLTDLLEAKEENSYLYFSKEPNKYKIMRLSDEKTTDFNISEYQIPEPENNLIPIKVDNKWGYLDENLEIVIKPTYDEANKFYDGYAKVSYHNDDFNYFINTTGEIVLKLDKKDSRESYVQNGLIRIGGIWDGLAGLIKINGDTILRKLYTQIYFWNDGIQIKYDYHRGGGISSILIIKGIENKSLESNIKVDPKISDFDIIFNEHGVAFAFKNKKWCLVNKELKKLTKYKYDYVLEFQNGIASVCIDNKWGAINTKGEIVIEPKYEHDRSFWGFKFNTLREWVDIKGERFDELYSIFIQNGNYGIIDNRGRILINPTYKKIEVFDNSTGQGILMLIDHNNKKTLHRLSDGWDFSVVLKVDSTKTPNKEILDVIKINQNYIAAKYAFNNYYYFHNITDRWSNASLFPISEELVVSEGIICSKSYKGYQYLDTNGNIITGSAIQDAGRFFQGYAPVSINGKWGYINKEGKLLIQPQFDRVGSENIKSFIKGYGAAEINGHKIIIDTLGNPLKTTVNYDEIESIGDCFIFKEFEKYQLFDAKQKVLSNISFRKISKFSDGMTKVNIGYKYGFINEKAEIIIPAIYADASFFSDGVSCVSLDYDRWGYINKDNTWAIIPQYSYKDWWTQRPPFNNGWMSYLNDGGYFESKELILVNKEGKLYYDYEFIDKIDGFFINESKIKDVEFISSEVTWIKIIDSNDKIGDDNAPSKEGYINSKGEWVWGPY